MHSNRRNWLKQVGLGIAGISLSPLTTQASPSGNILNPPLDNKLVRLSFNENPYGPSPLARAAISENFNTSNRYNWGLTSELVSEIAKKNNLMPENIILGAGSSEILDLIVRYAALQKGNFIYAEPTFNIWVETAQRLGLEKVAIPLTEDKKHDLNAMLKAIKSDTRLIYICNPNNPTATICDRDSLVSFIKEASKQAVILVDEAYIDFTEQPSLSSLVLENKNVVIAKTFSKIHGLAGARVGYGIAHAETMDKVRQLLSWVNGNISVISASAALASLKDEKFIRDTYFLNAKARNYTLEQLKRLNLKYIPSNTNFIYFSLENYKKDYFEQLKNNQVTGTRIYEQQGQWTRITVGTMEEMQQFIRAIE